MYISSIRKCRDRVEQWLREKERHIDLPLYTSVDIRNAGYKMAVVDTNLFPAGFNNLSEHSVRDAQKAFAEILPKRVPSCQHVLIIAEEHTRNTFYLENVWVLENIIRNAGFEATVATFLFEEPKVCEDGTYIELDTAGHHKLKLYCLKSLLRKMKRHEVSFDLIILNNDLTDGIPPLLKSMAIPIYPSMQAGWHSRLKSHHFKCANELLDEFASMVGIDPWFVSAKFTSVDGIDINVDQDREKLAVLAEGLFKEIHHKFSEYSIKEKPLIFLKADAGTYGMGVQPIEHPQDIIAMNRKVRNKLYKGKGGKVISKYILQEGIPSARVVDHMVAEACLYQIENRFVGGFYRINSEKSNRQNLNSQGMIFKKMDLEEEQPDEYLDIYQVLARVAAIAAHCETAKAPSGASSDELIRPTQ